MPIVPESILFEGISVDVRFESSRPTFGDLFMLTGSVHPRFPPSGAVSFDQFDELQFDQVDDYFGVPTIGGEGDDVAVWLYPIVGDSVVDHDPGPFDALRLEYSVLRHPARRAEHFLKCVGALALLGTSCTYRNRELELGVPPDLAILRDDISTAIKHWSSQNVVVGSHRALLIDF